MWWDSVVGSSGVNLQHRRWHGGVFALVISIFYGLLVMLMRGFETV